MRRLSDFWRFTLTFVMYAAALILAWLGFSHWIAPRLIDAAYHGRSLAILNKIIAGQSIHTLDFYIASWERVAFRVTLGLGLTAILLYPILLARRRLAARASDVLRWVMHVPLSARDFLHTAAWMGAVIGFLEGIYVVLEWAVTKPPSRAYSPDVLWMAPITTAILFLLGGLIVFLAIRWRSAASQGLAVIIATFVGTSALLRLPRLGLQNYAILLLALGVAVSVTRLTNARSVPFRRLVRSSSYWLAGGVLVLAAGFGSYRQFTEWRALRSLPSYSPNGPNILLLILDTVRASNLSLYGYARPTTPYLEQFASTGVTFQTAIAPSPWTLPSHATMFTGRHTHELSADWMTPLDASFPTLAEALAAEGYETGAFVANYYYAARETGLARGFMTYDDYPVSLRMFVRNSWLARWLAVSVLRRLGNRQLLARRSAEDINARFLQWLSRRQDRPFFAFLNYFDSHDPYLPPSSWTPRFSKPGDLYWSSWAASYSPEQLQELTNTYDSTIDYVDTQIGNLLDTLKTQGLLTNTLVIIAADHGEQFGEQDNRLTLHGNSLYMSLLHTPLIMVYPPHIPLGRRIETPVSLRDIPATVMEFASKTRALEFPGAPLSVYWSDTAAPSRPILSSVNPNEWTHPWEPVRYGPMNSLVLGKFHYIRNGAGMEELFDLTADPGEHVDLSSSPDAARVLSRLRQCLDEMLASGVTEIRGRAPQKFSPACVHEDADRATLALSPRGAMASSSDSGAGP